MKYLGAWFENIGGLDIEINNRIQAASQVFHAINKPVIPNKFISKKTKVSIYKTVYQPILTYSSESCLLSKSQVSKIQAAEMKFLRRAKGVSKIELIKNQDIRKSLHITAIQDTLEEYSLGGLDT